MTIHYPTSLKEQVLSGMLMGLAMLAMITGMVLFMASLLVLILGPLYLALQYGYEYYFLYIVTAPLVCMLMGIGVVVYESNI